MSAPMISVAVTSDIRSSGTPGADTNFFATDKQLPPRTLKLSITIQCTSDSVVTAIVGGVAIVLNDGNAITGGKAWDGFFDARPGTFNMQIDNAGAVQYLAATATYGGS